MNTLSPSQVGFLASYGVKKKSKTRRKHLKRVTIVFRIDKFGKIERNACLTTKLEDDQLIISVINLVKKRIVEEN